MNCLHRWTRTAWFKPTGYGHTAHEKAPADVQTGAQSAKFGASLLPQSDNLLSFAPLSEAAKVQRPTDVADKMTAPGSPACRFRPHRMRVRADEGTVIDGRA